MDKKVTKKAIDQLILEELEELDEETLNELMPGAGMMSGIKAMGGGLKAQFHKGRAGALGQKIAKKYQGEMAKVQQQLGKISKNFEKEYAGYAKNPFLKQMLDDAKVLQQLKTATGGLTGATRGFARIVQQSAEASQEAPTTTATPTPSPDGTPTPSPDGTPTPSPDGTPDGTPAGGESQEEREARLQRRAAGGTRTGGSASNPPVTQQEARRRTIKKAQKLLKENKKIKVVKSNGRKK